MMIVIIKIFFNEVLVICYFYRSNYNFQLEVLLFVNIANSLLESLDLCSIDLPYIQIAGTG